MANTSQDKDKLQQDTLSPAKATLVAGLITAAGLAVYRAIMQGKKKTLIDEEKISHTEQAEIARIYTEARVKALIEDIKPLIKEIDDREAAGILEKGTDIGKGRRILEEILSRIEKGGKK